MNTPLEFRELVRGASDEEQMTDLPGDSEEFSDVPCSVAKSFQDADVASALHLGSDGHRHVRNLAIESQARNAAIAAHYKKIAVAAKKTAPPASAWDEQIGDDAAFAKRKTKLNAADTKYFQDTRAWLARQSAKFGKNASAVVDDWCQQNPHRSAEVEADLRAIAATF